MNRILTAGIAVAAAFALTACGGGDSGGAGFPEGYTPNPYPAPPISESLKTEYLNAVNAARAEGRYCGDVWMDAAPPLTWNDKAYKAAYEHAQDMAATGYFSHTGSGTETDWTSQAQGLEDGSTIGDRAMNNGMMGNVSENLVRSSSVSEGADSIMPTLLGSPLHCESIMSKYDSSLGMAHVGHYWALVSVLR